MTLKFKRIKFGNKILWPSPFPLQVDIQLNLRQRNDSCLAGVKIPSIVKPRWFLTGTAVGPSPEFVQYQIS